jgi:predicted AAA+ superfamily ATPase
VRAFATEDPRAYLAQFSGRVIIDEIQRVPALLSYIQAIVDDERRNGRFILTGSHQPQVRAAVSQSLAGRVALLHLLPLSIRELRAAGTTFPSSTDYAYRGFLPRIYDRKLRPSACYTKRQKVLYYTSRLSGYIKGGWPDDYLSWESGGSRN